MGFFDDLLGTRRRRSTYSKGMSAERPVKERLEDKGYLVRQSPGSRGPYDLYAMKGGKKLLVQVKSGSASLGSEGRRDLRAEARKKGATAVYMKVEGRRIRSRFV